MTPEWFTNPKLDAIVLTSEEWQHVFPNPKVLDPDGWDRKNFEFSWHNEPITLEEYKRRVMPSTCSWRIE